MTTVQIRRTPTPGNQPAPNSLAEGELAVDMAELAGPRLWVGVPTSIDPTGQRVVVDPNATSDLVNWSVTEAGSVPGTYTISDTLNADERLRIVPWDASLAAPPVTVEIGNSGGLSIGNYLYFSDRPGAMPTLGIPSIFASFSMNFVSEGGFNFYDINMFPTIAYAHTFRIFQIYPGPGVLSTVRADSFLPTGHDFSELSPPGGWSDGLPGRIVQINDSPTTALGSAVTVGGGTNKVLAWDTGTAWAVFAAPSSGSGGLINWSVSEAGAVPGAYTITDTLNATERLVIEPGAGRPMVIDGDTGSVSIGGPTLRFGGRPAGSEEWPGIFADDYRTVFAGGDMGGTTPELYYWQWSRPTVAGQFSVANFTANGHFTFYAPTGEDVTLSLVGTEVNAVHWHLIAQQSGSSAPNAFTVAQRDAATGTDERRFNIHPGTGLVEIDATGQLILALDPIDPMGAVTKQYADAISAGTGTYVPVDGLVPMTGGLEIVLPLGHDSRGLFIDGTATGLDTWLRLKSDSAESLWGLIAASGASTTHAPSSFNIMDFNGVDRLVIKDVTSFLPPISVVIEGDGDLSIGHTLNFANRTEFFPLTGGTAPKIFGSDSAMMLQAGTGFYFYAGGKSILTAEAQFSLYLNGYVSLKAQKVLVGDQQTLDPTDTTLSILSGIQTWDLITQSATSSAPGAFTIADAETGTRRLNIHPGATGAPVELLATGELLLALDPTDPMGAVTRQYVDALTSAGGLINWSVTEAGSVPGAYTITDTLNAAERLIIEPIPVGVPFPIIVGGVSLTMGTYLYFNGSTGAIGAVGGPLIFGSDAYMFFKAGPTGNDWRWQDYNGLDIALLDETGLMLPADPTMPLHAVTKQYADALTSAGGLINWSVTEAGTVPGAYTITDTLSSVERLVIEPGTGPAMTIQSNGAATLGGTYLYFQGGVDWNGALIRIASGQIDIKGNNPAVSTLRWYDGTGVQELFDFVSNDIGNSFIFNGTPSTGPARVLIFGSLLTTGFIDAAGNESDATISLSTSAQTWDLIAQSAGSSAPGAFTIADALTGTRRLIIDPGATDSDTAVRITDNGDISIGIPGSPSRLHLQGGGGLASLTFSGPMIAAFEGTMSIKAGHVNRATMYNFVDDIGAAIFSIAWRPDGGGTDYMFRVPAAAAGSDTDLLVQFDGAENWRLRVDGNVAGAARPTIGDLSLVTFVQGPGETERLRFPFSGGMVLSTGALTLNADPVNPLEAVTKQYLDSALAGATGGGAVISDIAPAAPTAGSLWFDSVNLKLCIFYDAQWVTV